MIDVETLVRMEERAHRNARASIQRRELQERQRRRLRVLRLILAVPAAIGWAIAMPQIMAEEPVWWVALGGAMLSVPWLSTWDLLTPKEARWAPRD